MEEKFDHRVMAPELARFWDTHKVYAFDAASDKRIYAIDTPPPTVSGTLGIHHFFSYTQADIIARYKRMRGFNVFYPMGFDNNGLPTELLVEKLHGTTAEKEGRKKFVKLVEEETIKYDEIYRQTWRAFGISFDWSLLYTTISRDAQRISQLSFLELNRMNRVYRRQTPTIWCPKDKTALSQMELQDKVLKSRFVQIRFSDEVTIATTRPELLPACVAIFVNPQDAKNNKLVGRRVRVPIFGQEVTVMADSRVDPQKGTGAVMCCTFGDQTDIEWYKAYNLPLRIVIDERGRMLPEYFGGLKIREAREKIIEDLASKGYVVAVKEIEHSVNVHERCKTEIEFLVKKQWYVRYLDLKEEFIRLGNELEWKPAYMHVRYDNWVNGLQWDWAISRQRYYGIPFPVWYCSRCDEPVFADEKELPVNPIEGSGGRTCSKCGSSELVPEEDIMDTWATSSLTPMINGKWKGRDEIFDRIYPMDLRPQAHDIISFWLFTTIVKCYLHTKRLPWKTAMISGHALDPHGKPMHKSLGNVIDPLPLIERYGTDALRHWASLSRLGDDASFQEKDVITGFKTVNKLWNVARFVEGNREMQGYKESKVIDRWILSRLMLLVKDATERLDALDYPGAKRAIDDFFWFFCDNYLEFIKYRIYGGDASCNFALNKVLLTLLGLYAPFMPYVTEQIYQELYAKGSDAVSLHRSAWPAYDEKLLDNASLEEGERTQKLIAFIRQWKHDNKMALNGDIGELVVEGGLAFSIEDVKGAMNISRISKGEASLEVPGTGLRVSLVK